MANIMDIVKLHNKTSRNGFDLSQKRNFTAKAGELLPFVFQPVLPGDVFDYNLKSFTRTMPLNTAAYARMREYYDFYFVPAEQLWNKMPHVLTQMYENLQHANGPKLSDNTKYTGALPFVSAQQIANYITYLVTNDGYNRNLFGLKRANLVVKLLSYLGYPDFSPYLDKSVTWSTRPMLFNEPFSIMPLLAYQKVYADFFRYSQWEKPNPSAFNCDYIKGTVDLNFNTTGIEEDFNLFDLRYSNFNKDLYFGLLPQAQYGNTAAVPLNISGSASGLSIPEQNVYFKAGSGQVNDNDPLLVLNSSSQPGYYTLRTSSNYSGTFIRSLNASGSVNFDSATMSILAFRQYENLQRWKEISQSVDQDYKQQIKAHWNVDVSDFLSGQSRYLGGLAQSLDINPIMNNNLVDDSLPDIKGNGTFVNDGRVHFESKGEYGFIIGIYHVTPIFDYCCGQSDPMVYLTHALDYPVPELDSIGMEQVPISRLINRVKGTQGVDPWETFIKNSKFLGYAPRYVNWKTKVDVSLGAFTGSMQSWILPFNESYLKENLYINSARGEDVDTENTTGSVTWSFFKVNPKCLNPLFKAQVDDFYDSDQFLVSSFIDCKVVRSLDVNGLPY